MKIQLSEHFTYGKLLRFTFPSIVMMVFSSVYGVVDGVFVSNFVGKTAFTPPSASVPYCSYHLSGISTVYGCRSSWQNSWQL